MRQKLVKVNSMRVEPVSTPRRKKLNLPADTGNINLAWKSRQRMKVGKSQSAVKALLTIWKQPMAQSTRLSDREKTQFRNDQ
ncbi:MAG TPA: hypothetical protein VGQ81_00110 [Acidobacteriota bacterium]|jgi:hypothetical protein|nr:hypothetical protein [Acidobacteriota bacterium]